MPISTVVGTNTVTTKDWLRVMEGVTFHSGEAPFPLPIASVQQPDTSTDTQQDSGAFFGTHIKEAVRIIQGK